MAVVALSGCGGGDDGGGGDGGAEPTAADVGSCLSKDHGLFVETFEAAGDQTGALSVKQDPNAPGVELDVTFFTTADAMKQWVELAPHRSSGAISVADKVGVAYFGTALPTPEQQSLIDSVKDCLGS